MQKPHADMKMQNVAHTEKPKQALKPTVNTSTRPRRISPVTASRVYCGFPASISERVSAVCGGRLRTDVCWFQAM